MGQNIFSVKKYSGELETFSIEKLKRSLHICGATQEEIEKVLKHIQPRFYDGISSDEIHKMVFSLLKRTDRIHASKYNLKRSIFDLGPTGYPFERMVSALLKHKGFKTEVGVILQGTCVDHEVDILAKKHRDIYVIECKFHSNANTTSNVKVPLYINSRFQDVQKRWHSDPNKKTRLKQGWLVTNTRFTSDAISYGKCIGLTLLSWNYPENNGIEKNVDRFGLYPITALTSLTKSEKEQLIAMDVILIKEIGQRPEVLAQLKLSSSKSKRVLSEALQLCNV